jgi:hypothetical protein
VISLENMNTGSQSTTLLCKRIDLAYTARNRVTSEWGKNYWDGVLAYLLRAANRLN